MSRWYSDWKKRHTKTKHRKKRIRILKKVLLVLISVFIALIMVSIIARAFFSIKILNLPQVANIVVSTPPADENGFTNILLMGQGTKDHDGKDLTDSIMLASINPNESKSVVLLSFPRDLYFLDTENMGKGKLNTFYRDYKGYLRYIKEMDKESASEEAIKEIEMRLEEC